MEFESAGKRIRISGEGNGNPLVILNTVSKEGPDVYDTARSLTDRPFTLAAIENINWNAEMSPWQSGPAASWDAPYAGLADNYISDLENIIIPEIIRKIGTAPQYLAIAGYSLGGLFAIYSLYRTSLFSRAASASGSMWFPDFIEFAEKNELKAAPDRIYLSLGDAESRKGSPLMRSVGEKTDMLVSILRGKGIRTEFELNSGNHFKDAALRMAKGIRWIISGT